MKTEPNAYTFSAAKAQNPERFAESCERAQQNSADSRREHGRKGKYTKRRDWWLYCSYQEFVAYLESIGK